MTSAALEFMSSSVERERLAATVCLGKLADLHGVEALKSRLSDPLYTVRSAAIVSLSRFSPEVIPALKKDLPEDNTLQAENLMLAVARLAQSWNAVDSLKKNSAKLAPIVRKFEDSKNLRLESAAFLAASRIYEGAELQKLKARLLSTKDPLVLARIRQAEQKLR
jgi:HEAT repeat protein